MDVTRRIRTRAHNPRAAFPGTEHAKRTRLIAKIVREVAAAGLFAGVSEFRAAVQQRLDALRIRVTVAALDDAISVVAYRTALTNTQVVVPAVLRGRVEATKADGRPFTHLEAAALLQELQQRLGAGGPRVMPGTTGARS